MIIIRREDFTREEWDAAETAIDWYSANPLLVLPPFHAGQFRRWVLEDWLYYIRREEHREAELEDYSPRKQVALMGAACTLERLS